MQSGWKRGGRKGRFAKRPLKSVMIWHIHGSIGRGTLLAVNPDRATHGIVEHIASRVRQEFGMGRTMSFNKRARLDPSQVDDRRGRVSVAQWLSAAGLV